MRVITQLAGSVLWELLDKLFNNTPALPLPPPEGDKKSLTLISNWFYFWAFSGAIKETDSF